MNVPSLEAAGYEWHYALLWQKPEMMMMNDDEEEEEEETPNKQCEGTKRQES